MKIIFAIILLATTAFAQQKTPPPPGAARPLNLPKVTEKKLSNGLTVVLAPLPNVPKISSILTFQIGNDRERSYGSSGHRADRGGSGERRHRHAHQQTDQRRAALDRRHVVTRQRRRFNDDDCFFALRVFVTTV